MARKAARLERAGALTPRDRMWAAIRSMPRMPMAGPWSPIEIHFLANLHGGEPVHVDSVISYLEGLSRAKPPYIECVGRATVPGRKRSELWQWRLLRDVGVEAPRVTRDGKPVTQGVGTERMWAAMKALHEFDHVELAQAASDEDHRVRLETAKTYCTFLCRAGYLALETRNNGPHSNARYRFVRTRNTGPRAPLITRAKEVMDANTGAIVWPEGAAT